MAKTLSVATAAVLTPLDVPSWRTAAAIVDSMQSSLSSPSFVTQMPVPTPLSSSRGLDNLEVATTNPGTLLLPSSSPSPSLASVTSSAVKMAPGSWRLAAELSASTAAADASPVGPAFVLLGSPVALSLNSPHRRLPPLNEEDGDAHGNLEGALEVVCSPFSPDVEAVSAALETAQPLPPVETLQALEAESADELRLALRSAIDGQKGARALAEDLGQRLYLAERERDTAIAGADKAEVLLNALAEGVPARIRAVEEEASEQVCECHMKHHCCVRAF